MHIPDNYLSPQTCGVMAAAMVPVWTIAVRKVREQIPKEKIPAVGVAAAFSFLGMMFNIPIPGGTTGHAVGATLIAALLGPWGACIAVSVALLLQALLFGDGGILSFGANCFNMAFVMPFVGYGTARLIMGRVRTGKGRLAGLGIGAYAGINAAALCAAIEFGIQPMLFTNAAGQALYCPYGPEIAVPAMMIGHLTVFGLAEVVYTTAVYAFLEKTSPDLVRIGDPAHSGAAGTSLPVKLLVSGLIILTPLGLLAEGTAWGEWGADEIASTGAGYTPAGMRSGFSWNALLPDYSVGNMPQAAGYVLSAVIGVAILVIVFKLISAGTKGKTRS